MHCMVSALIFRRQKDTETFFRGKRRNWTYLTRLRIAQHLQHLLKQGELNICQLRTCAIYFDLEFSALVLLWNCTHMRKRRNKYPLRIGKNDELHLINNNGESPPKEKVTVRMIATNYKWAWNDASEESNKVGKKGADISTWQITSTDSRELAGVAGNGCSRVHWMGVPSRPKMSCLISSVLCLVYAIFLVRIMKWLAINKFVRASKSKGISVQHVKKALCNT